jgi:hypothetical protein
MPNWCDNMVTLRHSDKSKIDALCEEMNKKNEHGHWNNTPLNHLRPRPADQEENWYDWNVNNWGTKWDASVIDWEHRDDNEVWISFESAWSPPTVLYEYLVENGWEVEAVYHEPGMGYAGLFTTEGGDEYYEYDLTDKESIESLPSDILEFAGLEEAHETWLEEQYEELVYDLEKSQWFSAEENPVRIGRYQVKRKDWDWQFYADWDGNSWSVEDVREWRGLTSEYVEEESD